jgi:hypothetical protein
MIKSKTYWLHQVWNLFDGSIEEWLSRHEENGCSEPKFFRVAQNCKQDAEVDAEKKVMRIEHVWKKKITTNSRNG